jgi:hypothetical protein
MNDLENPTPVVDTAANPATDPALDAGTVQTNGDANGQGAPVEEMFGNVDPKTLPPQLKSVYDNMLKGFKDKTTKVSETVKSEVAKATEAYRQKAETYDKILQQEDFVKQWNEFVQKANQSNDPATVNLPPELKQKLEKVDQIEQKLQQAEAAEVISAFKDAVDDKGNKLHPDFDKFSEMVIGSHPQAGEYNLLRAAIELAPGQTSQEKLDNGYKAAKAFYDRVFEEGKKAGMGRNQERAKNGTFAPSSVNAGSTAPRRPKDALEALQFARQGFAPNKE